MASYLSTATIGAVRHHAPTGRRAPVLDAIDPDLLKRPKPRTGAQLRRHRQSRSPAISGCCARSTSPPAARKLSFSVNRDTQPGGDFFFVEAHTVGRRRLDDAARPQRATPTPRPAIRLPRRADRLHPFLAHYLRADGGRACDAEGHDRRWQARELAERRLRAAGSVDLSRLRGPQRRGRAQLRHRRRLPVRRRRRRRHRRHAAPPARRRSRTTATRSTAGPSRARRAGSPAEHGRLDRRPRSRRARARRGDVARAAVAREPEIIDFLASVFGPYPFSAAGVDHRRPS